MELLAVGMGKVRDTISRREQVFTRCHRDRQSHETRYLVVCQRKATAVTWKRLNTVTIIVNLLPFVKLYAKVYNNSL